ncbi:MAG: cytochrome c oxidase subunit II [Deltaproteobacteria bacterium]|nr:cytochrome c oxidase subunit II [Deltaproteobacteria bacterium]
MKKLLTAAFAPLAVLFMAGVAMAGEYGEAGVAKKINDPAAGWDKLWHHTLIDITVIGVIVALIVIILLIKYRAKHEGAVGKSPKLSTGMMLGWALIPAFAFMADDFFLALKGWNLFNDYRKVPAERYEINMTASMWNWQFSYPNGAETNNELVVAKGKPVMLKMKSTDVVHSLYIQEYRVKEDAMPGRITYMWFYPKANGEFIMTCAEFCGVLHSKMFGKVKVLEPAEFDKWLEEHKPAATESKEGNKS